MKPEPSTSLRPGSPAVGSPSAAARRRAELGRQGEDLAAAHLLAQGWQLLDRNWRPGPGHGGQAPLRGELDLVAVDPDGTLVAVEVKTRRSERYGPPAAAVGQGKLRRLRLLATAWAHGHETGRRSGLRLDVISVLLPCNGPALLRHHRGVGL